MVEMTSEFVAVSFPKAAICSCEGVPVAQNGAEEIAIDA
jgi:hypothetical protein